MRRRVFLVAALMVLGAAAWYRFGGHRVPVEQPPLAELNVASLDRFKAEFNKNSGQTRVILLLSPT